MAWTLVLAIQVMNCTVNVKSADAVRTRAEDVRCMSGRELEEEKRKADICNRRLASLRTARPFAFHGTCVLDKKYTESSAAELLVPSIALDLPVAMGTVEAALGRGAGHMYGTSLPVGGMSTHTCLAGHSGVLGKELFTGLAEVREGDFFCVRTLDMTNWYRVEAVRVVRPEEASRFLQIVPGRDLVTLYTCTPLGINDKRLLVRGSRVCASCAGTHVYLMEEKMKMKKSFRWGLLFLCVLIMETAALPALGAESAVSDGKNHTLVIRFWGGTETRQAIAGARFTVTLAAVASPEGGWSSLVEKMDLTEEKLRDQDFAREAEKKITGGKKKMDSYTLVTNDRGEASVSGLAAGLYLVCSAETPDGWTEPAPFFAALPAHENSGEADSLVVEPKTTKVSEKTESVTHSSEPRLTEKTVTSTPAPTKTSEHAKATENVETGDTNEVTILLFLLAAAGSAAAGVIFKSRRGGGKHVL